MHLPEENQTWRRYGKCTNLSLEVVDRLFFFGSGGSPVRAKEFCRTCVVKRECLHYAILHDQDGVWAGTIKDERTQLKEIMLDRIIEQGLVQRDLFATPEPHSVAELDLNDPEVYEVYPLEEPAEFSFPIAHVKV